MDSSAEFDGRNTGSRTMTLSGGTTWEHTELLTITASTAFFTAAYLDVEMRLRSTQTPATRWTVPLQWLLAAAAVAALAAAILQNGAFVRLSRRTGDKGVQ